MAVVIDRSTLDSVPRAEHIRSADQRVCMYQVPWSAYELLVAMRGDKGRPRVTYIKGTLELMSPSSHHEQIKKRFAALVEAYLDSIGVRWNGIGEWLIENAETETAVEPDECYTLHGTNDERPDIAIEVVWTHGGVDKLAVYRGLGVPEVWFWDDGIVQFYVLGTSGYELRARSALLPGFDAAPLDELLRLETLSDVRQALRKRFD